MDDIGTALDHLAKGTTNDQKLIEQLIQSNATLTKNNKELWQQLKAAIQAINTIKSDSEAKEATQLAKIKKYEAKLDPEARGILQHTWLQSCQRAQKCNLHQQGTQS